MNKSSRSLQGKRLRIRKFHLADETACIQALVNEADLSADFASKVARLGAQIVQAVRDDDTPGLMEVFLAEYGLSTDEGVALMCLAEALLRVPDSETIDDLIEDKIAPSSWGDHLGKSSSSLVNAATWGLMLTGKVLDEESSSGVATVLHQAVKRLGEPVIRVAVRRAMKEMGNQFVLGETIESAIKRGRPQVDKGYTYSYDMLGEAALTAQGASDFFDAYRDAISALVHRCNSDEIKQNPGISVKLSALHPRYELGQRARVLEELVPQTLALALMAKQSNMGFNIDAEEAERLDLSLDVIEAVLSDQRLEGWDGFGVVVQAYSKRAGAVIDWIYALAEKLDRTIMVRLVKGAYWDSEIKRAQVEGVIDFPVFTHKAATDVSYICCAKKLLAMNDRIYPQFATHNAHTVAAVQALAKDTVLRNGAKLNFEFQRLHGMGESLYRQVMERENAGDARCRIYAPVGAHRDLLAYLVRRLLENGANSSFVNQLLDQDLTAQQISADPFEVIDKVPNDSQLLRKPCDLFMPERVNSNGWDLRNEASLAQFDEARQGYKNHEFYATPLLAGDSNGQDRITITSPYRADDLVGSVLQASEADVALALAKACAWSDSTSRERAATLREAANLFQQNHGLFFAVLTREAGKTPLDAVAELREAVDFLRYYAAQIEALDNPQARGTFVCISPWNFPLAIFTGQVAAAIAGGNAVLAKPAESTPIVAFLAVQLMHQAGVPRTALQFLPGEGKDVGAALVASDKIQGVCFTGSTQTAITINQSMASSAVSDAPLIAETGGLNTMIVDSTALPEQAVKDIVASAFQSAGQRCSALRLLYLQEDIADEFIAMLFGAMDELVLGDPWRFSSDVGPVISEQARSQIQAYVDAAKDEGRLLKQLARPQKGNFVAPCVIEVAGISDMRKEVFGPVLHIAKFRVNQLSQIVDHINQSGFGLTFGLHTRIDDRVELLTTALHVGNMYINRNQIGAVVGSQPFGGEGLSGTGPKAGGPHYLKRFVKQPGAASLPWSDGAKVKQSEVQAALDTLAVSTAKLSAVQLPGPTGESNRLALYPRGRVLCLGPSMEAARAQADIARRMGCSSLIICPGANGEGSLDGVLESGVLTSLGNFEAVVSWANPERLRDYRLALSKREGAIIPLLVEQDFAAQCVLERHVCIDTTAAGGNASLLAGTS